tara:strand:+ start:829 stop:3345 length:2517 start_codon:yes stop_codon:yes gene_type:complete
MSYKQCIINGVREGLISEEQAHTLNKNFDEVRDFYQFRKNLSKEDAEKAAAKKSYDELKIEQAEKLRYTIAMKNYMDEFNTHFNTYRNANGEVDYANAYRAKLAQDNISNTPNIERQTDIERGKAHQLMSELLDQFRYGWGGRRSKLQKTNIKIMVREIFGENTGNQNAKDLAKAWKAAAEHLRKRFNYFGGKVLSRKDWGLPQIHDTLLVRSVTKQYWVDYVLPKLDLDKMVNETTGLPFSDKGIREALEGVYDNIATEGMATFKPGTSSYGKALHNRKLDHRFLAFKSADDWMEYQARFGTADPFKTMMDHISGMARDIGMMKILGPNPDAIHTYAKQVIRKQTGIDVAAEAQGKFKRKKILKGRTETDRTEAILENSDNLYAYHKGSLHRPIDGYFGSSFAALRQILTSAQLGGAAVMAITDFHWSRITSKFNGLKTYKANTNSLKFLKEGMKKDKALARTAIRLGLIAEHWSTVAGVAARYLNEVDAPFWSKRVSDFVLRGTGLSHITQSGKWAFGMSVMGELADQIGKPFSKLDKRLSAQMQKYGIGEKEWDIIRTTKLYDAGIDEPSMVGKGATFLRPDDIMKRADLDEATREFLTTRLLTYVTNETNFAVPTASAKGRITLAGSAQPGTFKGEIINSVLMYKNFPITLGMTHLHRGLQQVGLKGKMKYLVPMVLGGALMGSLAYEIKQVAAGKKPTPPSAMGVRYWLNAMIYGGGLGIFGDFLFQDTNRYGGSFAKTLAGPVAGFIGDSINLTAGNLAQLVSGEKTNAGKELAAFIQRYTPGSNAWYVRLVFERIIFDTIEKLLNPNYDTDNRRRTNLMLSRTNQEYWWSP